VCLPPAFVFSSAEVEPAAALDFRSDDAAGIEGQIVEIFELAGNNDAEHRQMHYPAQPGIANYSPSLLSS
jgi:hypothetical protein